MDPYGWPLVAVSLAFFVSFCLNIILCFRRQAILCTDTDWCCYSRHSERESLSQMEGSYFRDLSLQEQEENPQNHHEQQENPIYGNINAHRSDSTEVHYEMMTLQSTRNCVKALNPDLNYASLDLKKAKLHKKKKNHQLKARNQFQDLPPDHVTPPASAFLEVDADMDAHLPPRDTSTMVSHSSIYLNSQQIAQETHEMERERNINREESQGWDSRQELEEQGREERKDEPDSSNGDVCVQLSELETN